MNEVPEGFVLSKEYMAVVTEMQ